MTISLNRRRRRNTGVFKVGPVVGGGGGGGGGPAGDVLGFTGPQSFNNDGGFVSAFTGDLAARPFTFTIDFVRTGGITAYLWEQWESGRRSHLMMAQNGVNHMLQGTTNGTSTTNLMIDTSLYVQDVRRAVRLERVGDVHTLYDNDTDAVIGGPDTDTGWVYHQGSGDPHILGSTLVGTIFSASLVFND